MDESTNSVFVLCLTGLVLPLIVGIILLAIEYKSGFFSGKMHGFNKEEKPVKNPTSLPEANKLRFNKQKSVREAEPQIQAEIENIQSNWREISEYVLKVLGTRGKCCAGDLSVFTFSPEGYEYILKKFTRQAPYNQYGSYIYQDDCVILLPYQPISEI